MMTHHLATLEDIPALLQMEKRCFTTDRLTRGQFKRFIQSESASVVTVKQQQTLVAAAVLLFRKRSSIARLYSIAVEPALQRQGIAQMLYHFVEQQAIKQHCSQIRLEVRKDNPSAIAFYKKNGYEICGEYPHFYEDGSDAFKMRKFLS